MRCSSSARGPPADLQVCERWLLEHRRVDFQTTTAASTSATSTSCAAQPGQGKRRPAAPGQALPRRPAPQGWHHRQLESPAQAHHRLDAPRLGEPEPDHPRRRAARAAARPAPDFTVDLLTLLHTLHHGATAAASASTPSPSGPLGRPTPCAGAPTRWVQVGSLALYGRHTDDRPRHRAAPPARHADLNPAARRSAGSPSMVCRSRSPHAAWASTAAGRSACSWTRTPTFTTFTTKPRRQDVRVVRLASKIRRAVRDVSSSFG